MKRVLQWIDFRFQNVDFRFSGTPALLWVELSYLIVFQIFFCKVTAGILVKYWSRCCSRSSPPPDHYRGSPKERGAATLRLLKRWIRFEWAGLSSPLLWRGVRGEDKRQEGVVSSFVLKQKKQKFKAGTSYATNLKFRLNHLNLLRFKQQMILNASTSNLLNATKFKALSFTLS